MLWIRDMVVMCCISSEWIYLNIFQSFYYCPQFIQSLFFGGSVENTTRLVVVHIQCYETTELHSDRCIAPWARDSTMNHKMYFSFHLQHTPDVTLHIIQNAMQRHCPLHHSTSDNRSCHYAVQFVECQMNSKQCNTLQSMRSLSISK